MSHTHEYDCIVCGEHFDDSQTLARHNERAHLATATGMERPRQDGAVRDTTRSAEANVDPAYAKDQNPRQGFQDPLSDSSDRT